MYIFPPGSTRRKERTMFNPGQEVAAIGIILGGALILYDLLDYCYCLYFHKFDEDVESDKPNLSRRLDKRKE